MAQTVLQQVLILAAMMMLGFLLGKLGKVERKGADLLSMLLLDVFFPCNILAAASGDFGDSRFLRSLRSHWLICPASFCLHFWPSRSQNCSG